MEDPNISSARKLVLFAMVFQVIVLVVIVLIILVAFAASAGAAGASPLGASPGAGIAMGIAAMIVLFMTGFASIWIILDYVLVYARLTPERFQEAESSSMIMGILQILFGGVISGILLLVAHGKIVRAVTERSRSTEQQSWSN